MTTARSMFEKIIRKTASPFRPIVSLAIAMSMVALMTPVAMVLGAASGHIAGWFYGDTIRELTGFEPWKVGAVIGFIAPIVGARITRFERD